MFTSGNEASEKRLLFSKQPVFGPRKRIWGHDLIVRDAPWARFAGGKPEKISPFTKLNTRDAKSYAFMPGQVGETKILVPFAEHAVLKKEPQSLPEGYTIIEVSEARAPAKEYLWALDGLKRQNYQIALNDFEGHAGSDALLQRADFAKIRMPGKTPRQIMSLVRLAQDQKAEPIAVGVENKKLYEAAQALGFNYFQGSFFKKANVDPERRLTATEHSKIELFNLIENGTPDFTQLADAIAMDASISYRLLLFLNSAAFSFPVEITSINHAVVILGWEQVKDWLRMAILNDLAGTEESKELMRLASQRSNFFKMTAVRSQYRKDPHDRLFLLGLFSLLEPMLGMPIESIVENLPIKQVLKEGLCRQHKRLGLWIELAQRIEAADWQAVDKIVDYLDLRPEAVAGAYYDAHVVMHSFYGVGEEEEPAKR